MIFEPEGSNTKCSVLKVTDTVKALIKKEKVQS